MKILVGCEFSQVVAGEFRKKGHDAFSCDLLPTEGQKGWHIQDDVLNHLNDGWDIAVFHPPCTYLCNSGVRWLYERQGRFEEMKGAAEFFKKLLCCDIPRIVIENPIPHRYALEIIGRKYDQIIQPWMFGHPETKATCLWLKGLPKLEPTNIVGGRKQRAFLESPSPDRWKNRSRTIPGIAAAMAEQWG